MKVNYIKHWDDNGYVINQNIKCESSHEFKECEKFFTNYTKKQKDWSYSLWLTATQNIKEHFKNTRMTASDRILYRNTILYYNQ